MTSFGLHGKFTAQPGQRDQLVELLLQAAKLMSAADGCRLYVVSTAPNDEKAVWVTEIWDTKAEHAASLSLDGVPELIEQARPLIAAVSDRSEFAPVGGKGLAG
jgi:quinol monooxygenase YgiN